MKRAQGLMLVGLLALSAVNTCARQQEFAETNETQDAENMKLSNQWKTLTRDQRRAWNAWAKSNKVLLDDGSLRRVSGHKAMTMVLRNRAVAGEAANAATIPAAVVWLQDALTISDAGPFTENTGFMGFRTNGDLTEATKWFVWATPPLDDGVADAQSRLRFITCLNVPVTEPDAMTPDFAPTYRQVLGSFNGPGDNGEWIPEKFIWFRLHQYANGQLGPGVVMKGRIQVEL